MTKGIEAVIFDVDGVLIQSDEALYRVYAACLKEFGFGTRSRREILRFVGLAAPDWLRGLIPNTSEEKIKEMGGWISEAYAERYLPEYAKATPSAKQTLEALKNHGVLTAVVTNQLKNEFRASEEKIGFHDFDAVVCGRQVEKPKPAPDALLKALELLKCPKENALYVGDSRVDCECGEAAGVKTVLLENQRNKELKCNKIPSLVLLPQLAALGKRI